MSELYRVSARTGTVGLVAWAGSMAEARKAKARLSEETGVPARRIEVEKLTIEYGKAGVLEFLNEHARSS